MIQQTHPVSTRRRFDVVTTLEQRRVLTGTILLPGVSLNKLYDYNMCALTQNYNCTLIA